MAEPESGTIIEGVGDDVIRGLVGVVVVIVPILVTMFHRFVYDHRKIPGLTYFSLRMLS